ncbi:hypothetical protein KY290_031655 [Solanum tuberosum]|uniref:Uncharacterized protein n=1 Tax=Solanum tuberosum TaxID=4113 RepID=A0ABQ7U9V1_SOLTU|nr:hypothetical protein KY284_030717 [Solanum tuberosum]KAH0653368.1 hypothetical protein KY289_031046 [Solanum tuberosum]KAH0743662.1 hypothetical protein KY290_031655 [Solanum tuberosum]
MIWKPKETVVQDPIKTHKKLQATIPVSHNHQSETEEFTPEEVAPPIVDVLVSMECKGY